MYFPSHKIKWSSPVAESYLGSFGPVYYSKGLQLEILAQSSVLFQERMVLFRAEPFRTWFSGWRSLQMALALMTYYICIHKWVIYGYTPDP